LAKLAINQLESTTLLQMCSTMTLTHAAEMMLPADNGCCTRRSRTAHDGHVLSGRKARVGKKIW